MSYFTLRWLPNKKKQRRYAAVTGRSDVQSLRPPEGMGKGISGSSLNLPGPGKSPLGGPVPSNELLRGRAFQRVLQLHQRLGGKEGSAPYAARSETKGLRLDAME
jgi:hypothetical protein